ncbi:hypothetical protein SVAN01_07909 [Stagonosporopsis vannaccii]|nr:hypothetical protein SVAN01_07909 [Stagonosporopsis vannaccii]
MEDDSEGYLETAESALHYIEGFDGAHMPSSLTAEMKHDPRSLALPEGLRFGGAGNTKLKIRLSELERKEDESIESDHAQYLGGKLFAFRYPDHYNGIWGLPLIRHEPGQAICV